MRHGEEFLADDSSVRVSSLGRESFPAKAMIPEELDAPSTTEKSGLKVMNAHAFRTQGELPERTCIHDILARLTHSARKYLS